MTTVRTPAAHSAWTGPLCWLAVLVDGYDIVVLGVVLPVLLGDHVWGIGPGAATVVSTLGLVGMALGGYLVGTVTDLVGRRRALIASVALFSLLTLLTALATSVLQFGVLRFLVGLGMGGCLPTAITTAAEARAAEGKQASATATVMSGNHVGAVLCALLGVLLLPLLGWRSVVVVGGALGLVLVVPMVLRLPESWPAVAPDGGRRSARWLRDGVAVLFRADLLRSTAGFWSASFLGLLLVFGLNNWLPQIMRTAGYALDTSVGLLLALNLGGVVGMVVAGRIADRSGSRPLAIVWLVAASVFLALLSVRFPTVVLYGLVFLAGFFVFSGQAMVYALTQRVYPARARDTGLGWTVGAGRLGGIVGPAVAGALVTAGVAYPWGFSVFGSASLLAAGLVALVRVSHVPSEHPGGADGAPTGFGLRGRGGLRL